MLSLLTLIIFAVIALISAGLRPVYGSLPLKELKRRAAKGDQKAHILYQVSHHGMTADAVLVVVGIFSASVCSVILGSLLSPFLATVLIGFLIVFVFFIAPTKAGKLSEKIALSIAPYFAKLLIRIRPFTNRIARIVRKHRPITVQTGFFTKQDIIQLFEDQKIASSNQIESEQLDIALHALSFGDKKVAEVMTPKRIVHFVQAEEPIGPVLLTELHDSGFSRFPVRKEEDNNIVGTLFLKDLVERKSGGIVSNVMNPKVFYVNDAQPLEHVLKAFIRTKHHLFIVVNEFEDVVGIITIEDIIEQILGKKIVDEFDQYADLRAVAAKDVQSQDHHEHV